MTCSPDTKKRLISELRQQIEDNRQNYNKYDWVCTVSDYKLVRFYVIAYDAVRDRIRARFIASKGPLKKFVRRIPGAKSAYGLLKRVLR